MITEKVYKHTDYINSILFEEDGAEQDISAATRITLKIGGILIDSNTASASAFDWTTYGADGRLDLKLGHEKQIINLRKGPYRALIKIYDATYTNGLPWDELMMEVKDA